jgi:hypothetical protein
LAYSNIPSRGGGGAGGGGWGLEVEGIRYNTRQPKAGHAIGLFQGLPTLHGFRNFLYDEYLWSCAVPAPAVLQGVTWQPKEKPTDCTAGSAVKTDDTQIIVIQLCVFQLMEAGGGGDVGDGL